jgi:glycosyltransferase involved in cell wall biosynthesis
MTENKITVLMASFLGNYPNCADDREQKFQRAVNSFLEQSHRNAELIIVSDGCDRTDMLYDVYYKYYPHIRHFRIEKQPLFSGNVRQRGLEEATGKIVTFLDSDDMLGRTHLANINSAFPDKDYDWVYYNDFIYDGVNQIPKIVSLEKGSIGTSSIAHLTCLRDKGLSWAGCDGYTHDWKYVERLIKFNRYKKIYGCSYYICHIPNQIDT